MKTVLDVIEEDAKKNGQYAIDGMRKAPVDTLIVHHSAGADFKNKSPAEVIDFISEMHKERFYKAGEIDSFHDDRLRPTERTYCAYHFLMWPGKVLEEAGGILRDGWLVTPTMWGVLHNVAGGDQAVLRECESVAGLRDGEL